MRKLLMSIIFFSIFINLSTAIMIDLVPAFHGMDDRLSLNTDNIITNYQTELKDEFGDPISGDTGMEDSSAVNTNTLMDRVGLGALTQFSSFVNKYMFGFIDILRAIFGTYIPAYIFAAFKWLLSILYGLVMIELFTGKRLFE